MSSTQKQIEVDSSYANHKALATYGWIASTWWYHQKHFKTSKTAGLNVALFSCFSLFGCFSVAAGLHDPRVHQAYKGMGKKATKATEES